MIQDDKFILISLDDQTIRLYNIKSGKCLHNILDVSGINSLSMNDE